MTGKTSIEWTHQPGYVGAVWNPTVGCTRVSAGCDNCYAFTLHDHRYVVNREAAKKLGVGHHNGYSGIEAAADAREDGAALPFPKQYDLPFSRVQLLPERLSVPLRTRKPTCYFVDSMADLFHEDVPDAFIARVFATMVFATWHRFLILTKRPERMRRLLNVEGLLEQRELLPESWAHDHLRYIDGKDLGRMLAGDNPFEWPAPNVWLGTSVEDQRAADERIPHLLATPAAVRFLSCEPLLGPVDLNQWCPVPGSAVTACRGCGRERWVGIGPCGLCKTPASLDLDWVIVGGESGSRARPMDLAWARSLRDQCASAGVSFFMKQLGSMPHSTYPEDLYDIDDEGRGRPLIRESHGRNPDEWPADLRVREWPR